MWTNFLLTASHEFKPINQKQPLLPLWDTTSTQYFQIESNNTLETIYRSQNSQLIIIQHVVQTTSNSCVIETQADVKASP